MARNIKEKSYGNKFNFKERDGWDCPKPSADAPGRASGFKTLLSVHIHDSFFRVAFWCSDWECGAFRKWATSNPDEHA